MREYEYHLTPFAGGELERVCVMAQSRALGFSLAASQATDPNNVWRVRLVRDNGCVLDPAAAEGADVPPEYASSRSYPLPDGVPLRSYTVYSDLFGGAQARVGVDVSGRANAFTAGIAASDTPDDIREIWLDRIASEIGDSPRSGFYIDENKKYGGVLVDLRDPMIPIPSGLWK